MPIEQAVVLERRDRVLLVTINRPDARNAVDREVSYGLAEAMDQLDSDPTLSIAVLTGAGDNFCAGMDLKAFARGEDIAVLGRGLGFTERPPSKPVIAAVEGFALAGGTELALAADLIVASTTANFGIPEVKRGLVAGGGGLLRLPDRIPYQLAMELALTGDNLPAARAAEVGLVNRLTEPGQACEVALDLAATITRNGPLAIKVSKQVITESRDWPAADAFDRQRELIAPVFTSNDAKEGAIAFAEKRSPVWTGE